LLIFQLLQDELYDTIKDDIEVETEANVYEPFDEYVKQVEMKLLDDTSAEVENEMNVDVIGKQAGLSRATREISFSLGFPMNFPFEI
jgi:hypothetical protein